MLDVQAAAAEGPLARLSPQVRRELLAGHTLTRAAAGQLLHRPGGATSLHMVCEGLVRVWLASEGGRQVTVCYGGRGDMLGVPVDVARSAAVHAHAVTDAVIVTLRADVLLDIARTDPSVGLWIAHQMAARAEGLLHELAVNAFWPVRRRLIRHLLDLASDGQDDAALVVRASHQDLADHVGTVREVAARTLAELRAEGMIATATTGITLLDPMALAAEVN